MKTSVCWMALEQKAISRDVSETERPTFDLNHWRFSSIREMRAIGVRQMYEASSVRSSNACSGSVSRIAYFWRAARRAASLTGIGATIVDLPEPWFAGSSDGRLMHHNPASPRQVNFLLLPWTE